MSKVRIIAEIGENYIGDLKIAKSLIQKAARAGADYAKFQSYNPACFRQDDPEYDWFKKVSLSDQDHIELKECAKEAGIKFMSAPFSLERARFLCETLDLSEVKIASGMMLNFPVLDYINTRVERVFISTGMATLEEIDSALSHLTDVPHISILHCTTQYPCRDEDANLLAIRSLKETFPQHEIGYSDHTLGITAPVAAAALGAAVIEKHFTFDKAAKEGTDHILSVEPAELEDMVTQIRRVESFLGTGEKLPQETEKEIIGFVRGRFI